MAIDAKKTAMEAAKFALNPTGYLIGQLADKVIRSDTESPSQLAELRVLAEKQELEMKMAEAKARVAQELALAHRIETADEVEMEEFYDTTGEAGISARLDATGGAVAASGAGRRVTKRLFRFRGRTHSQVSEALPVIPQGLES